jgi:hypothetical protein
MAPRYRVTLTEQERKDLETLTDDCQDSCRVCYAASFLISACSAFGFSGFNHTSPHGIQFLVWQLQRSGFLFFAAS